MAARGCNTFGWDTLIYDTSRGVEGPGPMTLRQPTARHGGNAGIDEEVTIMAPKAPSSLDVRLSRAEGVLRERQGQGSRFSPSFRPTTEPWADYYRSLYP